MYDRTGLSTKCTLIKTGFKNLRTGTQAKIRPLVDALLPINLKAFQVLKILFTDLLEIERIKDVKVLVLFR